MVSQEMPCTSAADDKVVSCLIPEQIRVDIWDIVCEAVVCNALYNVGLVARKPDFVA